MEQLFLNSLFFFLSIALYEKKNIYIYKKGSLFYFSYGWWSCSAHCGVRPLAASLTWKLPARSEKRNIAPLILFFFFSLFLSELKLLFSHREGGRGEGWALSPKQTEEERNIKPVARRTCTTLDVCDCCSA